MPRTPDLAGHALDGRYELRATIGDGAFGRVYRGFDRRLARTVAVKVIKPWWAEEEAWVERFQREARLLASVSDPGVVQIFDIGHAEEGPYYVAEFVEGESLAQRLRRGPLPAGEARTVAEQLSWALASAHAQGVVHCDVKPANVLLAAAGNVKVGDFGVARLAEGTSQELSGTIAGTPRYMSPEQARGRPPTPATDVYSAGIVLYEMLAGQPPFAHGSPVEVGLRHLQDRPPPLPGRVPAPLREVVEVALAKDPDGRYRDGAAMAAALRAAAGSIGPSATEAPAGGPAAGDTDGHPAETATSNGRAASARVLGEPRTIDLAAVGTRSEPANPTDVLHDAPRKRRRRRRGGGRAGTHGGRRRQVVLLVTLFALVAGALVAFLLTSVAASTTVPNLRGLPRGGVEARARRLHVRPAFSARYSDTASGIAIAQNPVAGTHVLDGSTVRVVVSRGPPPVSVPALVGRPSGSAEDVLASVGLRYGATLVPAPGSESGVVTQQSPGPDATVPEGSTVALDIAEAPHWRALTSFSGVDDGRSVPFRILGKQWRVSYDMTYRETCLLVVFCFGPSAEAQDLGSGSTLGSFELSEGSSSHTFHGEPGLYQLVVSGGRDSARWSMTVDDYY
jgi:eukaryotic-like serine/threonine-protein kinase